MTIRTLNGDGVNDSDKHEIEAGPRRSDRGLPSGIWSMAFTELWERFSFYGLQGILTFYLLYSLADGGLDMGPAASAGIVGAYGGAVYLAQLLGAWMGERVLSPKHMVFWGGVVITAGHIVLAFAPGLNGLAIGLVLIVFGTGALKTNITNIVGFIVAGAEESRRDVGFAYFYMSINVGAVVGPLSTGFAQNQWGFHWGFGLAALGMVAALVQYAISMGKLPDRAGQVLRPIRRGRLALCGIIAVAIGTGIGWLIVSGTIRAAQLSVIVTVVTVLAAAWYFALMLTSPAVTSDEKARVRAYLPLFLIAGVFFGLLFQQFTAVAILISESVDLRIGTWTFPVAWVTMISQLAAVAVTPLLARFWGRREASGPSAPTKFAVGLAQIGVAYLLLLLIVLTLPGTSIPLLLMIGVMIVAGASEVFVGPVSLSLATRIGPSSFASQLVGLNFLTLALGSSLSGLMGQLYTLIGTRVYLLLVAVVGIGAGALLWAFRTSLARRLGQGLSTA